MGNCASPLRTAIRDHDAEKLEELLKDAGESAPDYINEDYSADCLIMCMFRNTRSPIHSALTSHDNDIVALLLKYGADTECTASYLGQTPLHVACRQNNLEVVKLLIDVYKVELYPRDDSGMCPIHTCCLSRNAIEQEDISVMQYLHAVGKLKMDDLDLTDSNGNTPIDIATKYGHNKAVEYLQTISEKS